MWVCSFTGTLPFPNDHFKEDSIAILIEEEDELNQSYGDLLPLIRANLPDILPEVVARLVEYEELDSAAALANRATAPKIFISVDDEFDRKSWAFVVEWDGSMGIHQEYESLTYKEIWGAS